MYLGILLRWQCYRLGVGGMKLWTLVGCVSFGLWQSSIGRNGGEFNVTVATSALRMWTCCMCKHIG